MKSELEQSELEQSELEQSELEQSELEQYLSRSECNGLSKSDRDYVTDYVDNHDSEYPVGRKLALGLLNLNNLKNRVIVSENFINWLYYY